MVKECFIFTLKNLNWFWLLMFWKAPATSYCLFIRKILIMIFPCVATHLPQLPMNISFDVFIFHKFFRDIVFRYSRGISQSHQLRLIWIVPPIILNLHLCHFYRVIVQYSISFFINHNGIPHHFPESVCHICIDHPHSPVHRVHHLSILLGKL